MAQSPGHVKDESDLGEFGYKQELNRSLSFWTTWALGFAFVSPIVGLYTVVALGATTAGPAWVWALPIVIVGQLLVAFVYASLATRWPIAGGIYQWSRRLIGPKFGWWAGWIYMFALIFTLAGVSYAGGTFLSSAFGVEAPSKAQGLLFAVIVLVALTAVNSIGLWVVKYTVLVGISAELIASVVIGLSLLIFFRHQPVAVLWDTSNVPPGATFGTAFVAALAFCGWAILGFDACGSVAEETRNPKREVPRAILLSLIPVALVEMLGAAALMLSLPDLRAVVNGTIADPVAFAVSNAFGNWITKPFLGVVVIGFVACGISIQATAVRVIYSFARDEQIPFSRTWRKVWERNHLPINAVVLVTAMSLLTFFYANALAVLVTFATGAYFLAFLAPVAASLVQRVRGQWQPSGSWALGRWGLPVNLIATAWLIFELINIAWPRKIPGAAWWHTWSVLLGLFVFIAVGLVYFLVFRPDRRIKDEPMPVALSAEVTQTDHSTSLMPASSFEENSAGQ